MYIFFSGAFLIVYFIAMTFCGIPVFFQEVAIGQYLGSGGMTLVAQLCPLLKGVGIATMVLVFFLDIYYCVIIAWTIFYMIATFTQIPALPWDTCGKNHYSIENEWFYWFLQYKRFENFRKIWKLFFEWGNIDTYLMHRRGNLEETKTLFIQ